jgi:hypothetical protein
MSHAPWSAGRDVSIAILCTGAAILYGVAPVLIAPTDFLHGDWIGHARLHVVWQTGTNLALACLAVGLASWPGVGRMARQTVATLIGCSVIGGFWVAAAARGLYGGTLSTNGGVPPLAHMHVSPLLPEEILVSIVLMTAATALQGGAVALMRRG